VKIHEEPCTCGAAAKIKVHDCQHPEVKRCVTTNYDLQKIKDVDARNNLQSCENCPHQNSQPRFVTTAEFDKAIKTLIAKLPENITHVIGVARSGLYPASVIAMYLHLPLSALNQKTGEVQLLGSGWRLKHNGQIGQGKCLIVDDTIMTGNSLTEVERTIQIAQEKVYAAVFVNPLASFKPDVWGEVLAWPHLLEWNLFNSVISPSVATDFDGILCRDCRPEEDDDGEDYLNFINTVEPTNLRPRKVPIPLIVTARIEKYRAATEAWLHRHQIKFQRLVMHPAGTLAERNRDNIPAYKARHFTEWAKKHRAAPGPILFIESEARQAQAIARISKRSVVCPSIGKVYQ
jgi:hypoxanthine phosphoribosyltransferase